MHAHSGTSVHSGALLRNKLKENPTRSGVQYPPHPTDGEREQSDPHLRCSISELTLEPSGKRTMTGCHFISPQRRWRRAVDVIKSMQVACRAYLIQCHPSWCNVDPKKPYTTQTPPHAALVKQRWRYIWVKPRRGEGPTWILEFTVCL